MSIDALPGSQNGWNHSVSIFHPFLDRLFLPPSFIQGRLGTINVLNGVMGLANAERSLSYIRVLAEFISQPQYKDVIPLFGITNEPQASVVGMEALQA